MVFTFSKLRETGRERERDRGDNMEVGEWIYCIVLIIFHGSLIFRKYFANLEAFAKLIQLKLSPCAVTHMATHLRNFLMNSFEIAICEI